MPGWCLPDGYVERREPAFHDDAASADGPVVHQPELYDVADYLISTTGRSTIIDLGCGNARKLRGVRARRRIGIGVGPTIAWCRKNHADWGEWHEADLSHPRSVELAALGDGDCIAVCADVVEHLPDPRPLLALLAAFYERGAIVITSTPDRIRVRGPGHLGPPANKAHVREWALPEYVRLLTACGLPPLFAGYTLGSTVARAPKTIVTLHDVRIDRARAGLRHDRARPVAIIAAYNEADVIDEVVHDLLVQGCDVIAIDNWSTDGTWDKLRERAAAAPGRVEVERFPVQGPVEYHEWHSILRRKEEIALRFPGRWVLHTDADELRRSPFPDLSLSQAFAVAEGWGANRVSFNLIVFRPVAGMPDEAGPLEQRLQYFEFGTNPGHFRQWKAWLQGSERVDLASTAGHAVQFDGIVDFPYRFLLKHYSIRSAEHGRRKILVDRLGRMSPHERHVLGWHVHYEAFDESSSFLWSRADLHRWAPETFWQENGLLVMTDLVERRRTAGRSKAPGATPP